MTSEFISMIFFIHNFSPSSVGSALDLYSRLVSAFILDTAYSSKLYPDRSCYYNSDKHPMHLECFVLHTNAHEHSL